LINGSFWIGAAMGAVSAIVLLDPAVNRPDLGWRWHTSPAACLASCVRDANVIPESPRWLMIHVNPIAPTRCRRDRTLGYRKVQDPPQHGWPKIRLQMRDHTPLREVARTLVLGLPPALDGRLALDGRQAFSTTRSSSLFALA